MRPSSSCTGMWTVSSLAEVPSTFRIPSSSLRRLAASSKRAAAASHGFFSFCRDIDSGDVNVATIEPPVTLCHCPRAEPWYADCSRVTGSGTQPIVIRQLAVGIQLGQPCLSTALALEDKVPLVDNCDPQAIQFGSSHVADIFFVRRGA